MNSRLDLTSVPSLESRGRPLTDSVLTLLWRKRQMSRAEIARHTGLSRSTVSDVVSTLLETGLVAEVGDGPSRGGRRPVMLAFQDDAYGILGIDIGASHLSIGLLDLRGHVLQWRHVEDPGMDGVTEPLVELSAACLRDWGVTRKHLLGIGVAVPGSVDSRGPGTLAHVSLPSWAEPTGLDGLKSEYGVPFFVDNEANLGALAERWWGAGRGIDDFAYIRIATGVCAGFLIRGEVYRGATGWAGEIGEVRTDDEGPMCTCGNRGCLTTFVGAQALISQTRALLPDFPDSPLGVGPITVRAIEDAALGRDPLALQVVRRAAQRLGVAIADVLTLLNPAAVILGGGFARLDELLVNPLREAVLRRAFVSSMSTADIRTGEIGPQAIAVGAATLVLESALQNPRLFPRPVASQVGR